MIGIALTVVTHALTFISMEIHCVARLIWLEHFLSLVKNYTLKRIEKDETNSLGVK